MILWGSGYWRANLYQHKCNWGVAPLLFLTALIFPSSEESQAHIPCCRCERRALKVGWRGKFFLADQNQHVSKPTWVKLQCNRHSRSALKSVQNWNPVKNVFKKAEPNRPFIWCIISQVWWLVNGRALKVDHFLPGFTECPNIWDTS